MASEHFNQEEKKKSFLWSITKTIIMALFPAIKFFRVNQKLKYSNKLYKHNWFKRQIRLNRILSFLVSIPFLIAISITALSIYSADPFWQTMEKAKNQISTGQISRSFETAKIAFHATRDNKPSLSERVSLMSKFLLVGVGFSFIFGSIIILNHPLLKDTQVFYKMAQKNGYIDKDDNHRMVLVTPVGILMDITGSTAKEIKEAERIWQALNISIKTWEEDPEKRSICFFLKAYNLKSKYMYNFNDEKKS